MAGIFWRVTKLKYKDIIYPAITNFIDNLLTDIDSYIETVGEGDTEHLEDAYDALSTYQDEVTSVYLEEHDPCIKGIISNLSTQHFFHNFPVNRFSAFRKLLQLSVTVESDSGLNLDDEIGFAEDRFTLGEVQQPAIPQSILGYHNKNSIEDSLLFVNLNLQNIQTDISQSGLSNGLITLLIYHLCKDDIDFSKSYILHSIDVSSIAATSALKMNAALQGKIIHSEISIPTPSASTAQLERISAKSPYSQFEETLVILSEFNSATDLLRKYLSIYHIIESFMFKIPLVILGQGNHGNIFSLRDFRRLSEAVQDKELSALINIFKDQKKGAFWNRNISTFKFHEIIKTAAGKLTSMPEWDTNECNAFFKSLSINDNVTSIDYLTSLNEKAYCELIYKVRCAIVHNKETELHLSYSKINGTIAIFIEHILIKPLYTLISDLLTDVNSKVWYSGPELKLYQT